MTPYQASRYLVRNDVDYLPIDEIDGRIATTLFVVYPPGIATIVPGERIVVAPLDISALRHERETRRGHLTLAHLRTEAYPVYATPHYPPAPRTADRAAQLSYERNNALIYAAKRRTDSHNLPADSSAGALAKAEAGSHEENK